MSGDEEAIAPAAKMPKGKVINQRPPLPRRLLLLLDPRSVRLRRSPRRRRGS